MIRRVLVPVVVGAVLIAAAYPGVGGQQPAPAPSARGGVQAFDHPDKPGFKLVASPIRLDEPMPAKPAPKLGEHTDQLLKDLGISESELANLKKEGAI